MSLFASLRETSAPGVAVELASRRVSAATVEFRGGQPVVGAHASEPLPDGVLVPSLTNENIRDRALVAGAHAGIVDLATFNVINAVLASPAAPESDWLLVNVAADYASIAIVRGEHLMFFRNRAADTDGTLADLVHQTAMYYEDRLKGGGFARVVVSGAGAREDIDQVRRSLEERLTTRVDTVDPRSTAALTDRITA